MPTLDERLVWGQGDGTDLRLSYEDRQNWRPNLLGEPYGSRCAAMILKGKSSMWPCGQAVGSRTSTYPIQIGMEDPVICFLQLLRTCL